MRQLDTVLDPGAGIVWIVSANAPDDTMDFQVQGEAYPRIRIKPSNGTIVSGNGTVPPTTLLGGGGGGGGDMLAANNLSDVANAATSRTNLGLGTAATQNIGAFDAAGAAAAAQAASQPLDADLTAIAAVSTAAYGRALLATTNLAALQAILGPSGTPSGSTFLRGDGVWATPAGGGGGDMLAANNLSDVANTLTSRYNLHEPTLGPSRSVATSNVASKSGTTTLNGVSLVANDQVLLTAQTAPAENGPWLVQAGAWTRPADYPAGGTVTARMSEVVEGTFAGSVWCSYGSAANVTIDTTGTSWFIVNFGLYNAKGDIIVASADNAASVLTVGANGTVPVADSTATQGLRYSPLVTDVGRLIVASHSYGVTTQPYENTTLGDGLAIAGTDHSKWPVRLAEMLGVYSQNRIRTYMVNSVAAGSDATQTLDCIPEDATIEGIWYLPNAALTGANTNTRKVSAQLLGPIIPPTIACRQFNSGVNLVASQVQPIMELAQVANDITLRPQDASSVATGISPLVPSMTYPLTGIAAYPQTLTWVSTHVGTGLADPGGAVIVRYGGRFRNMSVGGARLTECWDYHGGWATFLMQQPFNIAYGVEVAVSTGATTGQVSIPAIDVLAAPIFNGGRVKFDTGVVATTTAQANQFATSLTVAALSGNVPAGSIGYGSDANGSNRLLPKGTHVFMFGTNDSLTSPADYRDRNAYKETMRAVIAWAQCPLLVPATSANHVYVAGNGASAAWATWTQPAAGAYMWPGRSGTPAGSKRFTGAVGGTPPTITIKTPAQFLGGTIDLFFLGYAGASKGGAASITVDGSTPPSGTTTVSTSSPSTNTNVNLRTTAAICTVTNGSPTLTATSGTPYTAADVGKIVTGTQIPAGTHITAFNSTTSLTMSANATGGAPATNQALTFRGYTPLVKRLTGLAAGAHTIVITLTGIDQTDGTGAFVYLGYGIESEVETPIFWCNVPKIPSTSVIANADVNNTNTDIAAVVAGTATGFTGNSTEPALPASVRVVDIDTVLGANTQYFYDDGLHPNEQGAALITEAIFNAIKTYQSTQQGIAR